MKMLVQVVALSANNLLTACTRPGFCVSALRPGRRTHSHDTGRFKKVRIYELPCPIFCTALIILVRYYALSAASALFKYAELKLNTQFTNGSLRIRYVPVDGTMMIDPETVRNLEIVGNIGNAKSPHSLFGYGLLQYFAHREAFTLPQRP